MKTVRIVFILASLLFLQFKSYAQAVDPAVADKISQVENNMLKSIRIEGDAPYSIQQDMKDNNVQGVSIAVIHNFIK